MTLENLIIALGGGIILALVLVLMFCPLNKIEKRAETKPCCECCINK